MKPTDPRQEIVILLHEFWKTWKGWKAQKFCADAIGIEACRERASKRMDKLNDLNIQIENAFKRMDKKRAS
jgi:hypothetical protein